ncbi:MAG: ABC transporter ATP-binding protein [Xanthobacteraceae bacterium]|nr:ABC transporter ATP-binding protein [Xanthobacteraceae bacterium]QYK44133.1 MAG: ABC transporter ATP-binding protein [Xanthobacteraceae bacterium]
MTTAAPLMTFEDVGHQFDDGRIVALRNVNIAFAPGQSVAIIGPSGSGKSTLIHLMCGIRTPSQGVIRWQGRPVATPKEWSDLRRRDVGIVFQEFNLFPTLTAAENVEMSLFGSGLSSAERAARVKTALADVGLAHRETHLPHELSGGERQRVAIARSIVNAPAMLLADEPTGNLDSANSASIMKLLFDLHERRGVTLVMVTHDRSLAAQCARIIEIRDGRLASETGAGAPVAKAAAKKPAARSAAKKARKK